MRPEWTDFVGGKWESEINVRDFIQKNYQKSTYVISSRRTIILMMATKHS